MDIEKNYILMVTTYGTEKPSAFIVNQINKLPTFVLA